MLNKMYKILVPVFMGLFFGATVVLSIFLAIQYSENQKLKEELNGDKQSYSEFVLGDYLVDESSKTIKIQSKKSEEFSSSNYSVSFSNPAFYNEYLINMGYNEILESDTYSEIKTENRFAVFSLKITSKTANVQAVNFSEFKLKFNSVVYSAIKILDYEKHEITENSVSINGGLSKTIMVVFEIPKKNTSNDETFTLINATLFRLDDLQSGWKILHEIVF